MTIILGNEPVMIVAEKRVAAIRFRIIIFGIAKDSGREEKEDKTTGNTGEKTERSGYFLGDLLAVSCM